LGGIVPLSVALEPSKARFYLTFYQASISPLLHWVCALFSALTQGTRKFKNLQLALHAHACSLRCTLSTIRSGTRYTKWAGGSRSQTHRRAAMGGFTQDDGYVRGVAPKSKNNGRGMGASPSSSRCRGQRRLDGQGALGVGVYASVQETEDRQTPGATTSAADFLNREGESREFFCLWFASGAVHEAKKRRAIQVITCSFPCVKLLHMI
jgi:hypothetical protein